jgi:hypothetical protein
MQTDLENGRRPIVKISAVLPTGRGRWSAFGGYAVSVKAEPIEEHKESGIILDLTSLRTAPE